MGGGLLLWGEVSYYGGRSPIMGGKSSIMGGGLLLWGKRSSIMGGGGSFIAGRGLVQISNSDLEA